MEVCRMDETAVPGMWGEDRSPLCCVIANESQEKEGKMVQSE